MRIGQLMAGLTSNTKTAAETPAPAAPAAQTVKVASAGGGLDAALNDALNAAVPNTKTASAAPVSTPAGDIEKIAADIAASEKEAALNEARILGTAFADAAVSRFGEYQKVASQMNRATVTPISATATLVEKIAATGDAEFDKYAAENPDVIKQALDNGFAPNRVGVQKLAQAFWEKGYNDTVEQMHKTAQSEFLKAAQVTHQLINQKRAADAAAAGARR